MKKLLAFTLLFLITIVVAGCGSAAQVNTSNGTSAINGTLNESLHKGQTAEAKPKTLVVYFSHSGNTRILARQVQQRLNADILELKTVTPYTAVYGDLTKQAKQELESGFKPVLQPINIDLANYDTIVIASPIWWGTISLPTISFLSEHKLADKTVLPLLTHGGSGLARSVQHIRELCPQANVKEGLAVRSSAVNNFQVIDEWLNKLQ